VAADQAAIMLDALHDASVKDAHIVGRLAAGQPGHIEVSRSQA